MRRGLKGKSPTASAWLRIAGRRDIPDEEGTESSNIHAPRRSSCKPYEHRSRTGIRLASVFEPESSIAAGE